MENLELNLKKFVGFGTKVSRKVSITKAYSFGFPPALYKEYGLETFFFANIYFDDVRRVIGVKFLKEREEGAFKLIRYKFDDNKISASFVARSFFKTYKLNVDQLKGRYEPKVIESEDLGKIILLDLNEKEIQVQNNAINTIH